MLVMELNIVLEILIFIIGLVFGSFYNVVGYRLPNNMSIIYPGSNCPNCNHKLKYYELVPVLSYILLGGKCKNCKNKISVMYPIFELTTGLLFLLSYIKFGFTLKCIISIIFVSILIIMSISDIKYYIIPDEPLLFGIILIVVINIINCIISNLSFVNTVIIPILNALASFGILYILKVLGDYLFKKECMGGGDIKLLFLIGLVLGFDMSLICIFIASFIALPISVAMLIKKDNNVISFGPFLSLAAIIILFSKLNIDSILNFFVR